MLDENPLDDIGVVAGEGENVAYVMLRGTIMKARTAALTACAGRSATVGRPRSRHSTVTDFARFRGLSISAPRWHAA
ncbi:hypothetical protein DIE14_04485 [Burkholderia sp. Bp9017]|nr:hypothetical protein DIE14_04485 [Burkholderia sp. Bp9017]RQZ36418.1 hypothetical protein DIE13_07755 [Burkholderia sp. Bp9016]